MRTKRIGLVLGLLLLAGLGYMMWPFIVGGGQMEAFCNSLKSGATIDVVKKAVSDRGYRIALGKEPQGFIHDPRSFGRFICEVHFEGGHLNSATYIYND